MQIHDVDLDAVRELQVRDGRVNARLDLLGGVEGPVTGDAKNFGVDVEP